MRFEELLLAVKETRHGIVVILLGQRHILVLFDLGNLDIPVFRLFFHQFVKGSVCLVAVAAVVQVKHYQFFHVLDTSLLVLTSHLYTVPDFPASFMHFIQSSKAAMICRKSSSIS